jgi:hypothetical protein
MQAVEDYRFCKEFGLIEELKEVEDFFRSAWCDQLLLNLKLTGNDILTVLENE